MPYLATLVISLIVTVGTLFGYNTTHPSLPSAGASQTISALTELTSLSNNDVLPITDTANNQTKKLKWGTATATMKTVFDPIYSPIFSTSAGLAGLLSDETGSSGGFVRAGSPTLTSPTLTTPVINVGSDATGDLYYRDAGVYTRLPVGSSGQYLMASSTGKPEYDNTHLLTNPMNSAAVFNATTTFNGTTTWNGYSSGNINSTTTIFYSSGTWTKPNYANYVEVYVIGAGAGGAGGYADGLGKNGGGGGGYSYQKFLASSLSSSVVVTVGTGTPGKSNGTQASNAGNSSFGSYLIAGGGKGDGTAGTSWGGLSCYAGGAAGVSTATEMAPRGGGNGGSSGSSGSAGGGFTGGNTIAGGTAGSGCTSSNCTAGSGGNGTTLPVGYLWGGTGGGGSGGANPVSGTSYPGVGGNGGFPGGGGGGGGGNYNGSGVAITGGTGGNGADGIVIVITHF